MALDQAIRVTELYHVATTARLKLGKEACRETHRLRHLVLHANTLDYLMDELNQIKNGPVNNGSGTMRENCREPEEVPELENDSGSDDDSEDDLSDSSEEVDELHLVRYPIRGSAAVGMVETAEMRPQIRLNEAVHAAQRQIYTPSLDSIVENELSQASCKDAPESISLSKPRAASHVVDDSSSKIALRASLPSSTAKNSGGKQRSTARSPKSGRKDVCRKG